MIQKPPGIEDIFPDRIDLWNYVTGTAEEVFRTYNFREIIIPIMEYTDVFSRGLGDETDIVSKEMFTFEDRGGRSLTLRPEGTASVVRAYVENGEYNRLSTVKLFYLGSMFRAERPQRGRLRQFNQFGGEVFGGDDPWYDFEVIAVMDSIAKGVGIKDYSLHLNSIGCPQCRPVYLAKLREYYRSHEERLCPDCRKRLEKNPLRLLDCKNESCSALKADAPRITDFLDEACRAFHEKVKGYLTGNGIAYTENPFLVRGLDYYTRTTFEFVADRLGGQNAFAGGGRYDQLVEQFGGKPTPAVGFAAGIERMMLLLEGQEIPAEQLDVFVVHGGGPAFEKATSLVAKLRSEDISVDIDPVSKGFKSQFKKADREKTRIAVILGDDELAGGFAMVRDMATGTQEKVTDNKLNEYIKTLLGR